MSARFSKNYPPKPINYPLLSHQKQQIERLKLDIVHCHFEHDTFNYGAKIARTFGIPLFQTYYKVFPFEIKQENGLFKRNRYHTSAKKLIEYSKECDKIVALSATQKHILQNFGVITPIDVLPVGIFTKDYNSIPKDVLKKQFSISEEKIILYIGSINDKGNTSQILKTFKIIYKTMENIHLIIVGNGKKIDYYKQVASRQNFAKHITFTGALEKKVLNKIYGATELLIYPKTLDPEPLVILEAFAAGIPVVAQSGVGTQDLIKENQNGLLSGDSTEDFAEKIMFLLKRDKIRLNLSIKARLDAQNYRASQLTSDLLQSYDSFIK
jgi:glycosyltransferase involved in cell wall biosynthesis